MTKDSVKKPKGTKEITFKCKFCGVTKPLGEMRILTRFFPPVVACQDCDRELR
jgi:hypothetical protein